MAEIHRKFGHFVVSVIQKYTKFANFASVYFHVLQYFASKLGSFTNFNMLFLTVVEDFDFFAKMKIQFKRGMVHLNNLFMSSLISKYQGTIVWAT